MRQRQVDFCELRDSLVYRASSKIAKVILKPCLRKTKFKKKDYLTIYGAYKKFTVQRTCIYYILGKIDFNSKLVKRNKEGHSLNDDKGIKVGKYDLMGKGACLQA